MSKKRGDAVIFVQGGREYNALVLAAHSLNDSHLGKNKEPQLHLAVAFDAPKNLQLGDIPSVEVVHDVVHESHSFDADYMESHGLAKLPDSHPMRVSAEAEIRNRRGAGEWREVAAEETTEALDPSGDSVQS